MIKFNASHIGFEDAKCLTGPALVEAMGHMACEGCARPGRRLRSCRVPESTFAHEKHPAWSWIGLICPLSQQSTSAVKRARSSPCSEKAVRESCGNTAIKGCSWPTSGPTWRLSHLRHVVAHEVPCVVVIAEADVPAAIQTPYYIAFP